MRPLIIDQKATEAIQSVIKYADEHRVDLDAMKKAVEDQKTSAADDPSHICYLTKGYRIVFSIEQQKDESWYRHLSVSVDDPEKMPSIPAVELIMEQFGFESSGKMNIHEADHVWIEKNIYVFNVGNVDAVNVLQRIRS